jgi:hypothetical protein
MNEPTKVTEADKDIIADWFVKAKECKSHKDLSLFIRRLTEDYLHDYGTIVEACAAAANAAVWTVNASPQGGITGFQAGAVMWRFIQHFMCVDGPMKLLQFEDMLYPQYAKKFEKTLDTAAFKFLQEKAKEKITCEGTHPDVKAHMQSIIDGIVPFGYTLTKD